MIKLKNIGLLIFLVGVFWSACNRQEYLDNQAMMKSIDALAFSEMITEVEVDSMGNIIDTVSITKLKYATDQTERYQERTDFYKDIKMTTMDYLKEEDIFYRKVKNNRGEVRLIYESKVLLDGEIEYAIQSAIDGNKIDTTTMTYEYQYHSNGNKKMIVVKSFNKEDELHSKVSFDQEEQPLFEIMTTGQDTMTFQIWNYENDMLSQIILFSYWEGKVKGKTVYNYRGQEHLMGYTIFRLEEDDFVKNVEVTQKYNDAGDLVEMKEHDFSTDEVKWYKYLNTIL